MISTVPSAEGQLAYKIVGLGVLRSHVGATFWSKQGKSGPGTLCQGSGTPWVGQEPACSGKDPRERDPVWFNTPAGASVGTRSQGCIMSSRPQEALQDAGRQSRTRQWVLREWAGLRAGARAAGDALSSAPAGVRPHVGHWESSGGLVPGLDGQERWPQQRPLAKAHRPQVAAKTVWLPERQVNPG